MITNVPTADNLNSVALRLYFSAWQSLLSLQPDFEMVYPPESDFGPTDWSKEWEEYLRACQPELQSICTIIAQSNEMALKARICDISPFLLLLGGEQRFSKLPRDIDFSDFRTIDAVDLPGAVNTICDKPLSDKFIQAYNELRSSRNKITHLGHIRTQFHPCDLIGILVFQYTELWKERAWLHDRLVFSSQTRLAVLYDYKYTSEHAEVMQEWPEIVRQLSSAQFRALFRYPKNKRRYICHECTYNANIADLGLGLKECATAFLDESGTYVHCLMCLKDYKVARGKCNDSDCKGTVIGDNGDDYVAKCHTCGEGQ